MVVARRLLQVMGEGGVKVTANAGAHAPVDDMYVGEPSWSMGKFLAEAGMGRDIVATRTELERAAEAPRAGEGA